ncbi:universal stress protein [Burkholderia sp. TSV86]|uniref:universal stress protein n=1 Tax=Burkholderia sp. TSV86 TaxID=1385594 RepID=UPI0007559B8A|nr:universal stress protein [Burkholderia sp. TSV86]KVE38185.1 universal stress protein UspA [Burkholderia sp. TSV86]
MYQRIFVAFDGSRCASLALEEAVRIAAVSGGSVMAGCVVEHAPRLVDVGSGFVDEPTREDAIAVAAATAALEAAKIVFQQRNVCGAVRAIDADGGSVPEVLVRTAAQYDADLIVMGTHGRRGMVRMWVGSVAESVLRMADRPVLMVRESVSESSDEKPSQR